MTVLTTDRLILRDNIEADLPHLHRLLYDKRNMYFLDELQTNTVEETAANLQMAMANADGHYFAVLEKETGVYMGQIGYTEAGDVAAVHLGYFILPEFAGKGYTTEAVKRACAFAFREDGRARITTGCYKENTASERVMVKAGFRKVDAQPKETLHDGVMKERLAYALIHEDSTIGRK